MVSARYRVRLVVSGLIVGLVVLLFGLQHTLDPQHQLQSLWFKGSGVQAAEPSGIQQPPSTSPDEAVPPGKSKEPGHILSKFMRQKLEASTQILEGLCTEDLQMVSDGSKVLLSMSNEERWRVSNDIMYRRYSQEFAMAVEELQKEASDQDMDGTSLAWINVTMKCLKCHEWVRNTVLAKP